MVTVHFLQNSKQRHCYLRVKGQNQLQITANKRFTIEDAKKLIHQKKAWILKHFKTYENMPSPNEFYYLGEKHTNQAINKDELYAQKAKEMLPSLVQKHAQRMNAFPTKLSFRKNKTRFGSCSAKNAVSLNILLMKFPQEVIEYVIIHELAHIKHKNHSAQFWKHIEVFCPNYKILDKRLKEFNQTF